MKKLFTLLIAGLIGTGFAYGQCTPDPQYKLPGIYPDSATGVPPAFATYEYSMVFTAVIPYDTILPPLPNKIKIDSIGVLEVLGLPEGFTAQPSTASGFWHGGTSGCMLISGTPTESQVGTYPLQFKLAGYAGSFGIPIPYTIDFYSLTVYSAEAYGINDKSRNPLSLSAQPNPFAENTTLTFRPAGNGIYDIAVYDLMGRLLSRDQAVATAGGTIYHPLTGNLPPGTYFCVVRNRETRQASTLRLVKN